MLFSLFAITRIIHVLPGLDDPAVATNRTIEKLESSVDNEKQVLEIKDIKIVNGVLETTTYVIYELKDKEVE